ncbi:HNH endonuclease [Mycobacterium phage Dandelion]|uniref:HNH endonuclease n=1 Tax=Mycobacterium phage Dandelion TaxID=1074305 RepID=G1JWA9_9CAUD|nr:HNH endonuclease [Mycobacterium phage Dandelion]AEL97827.1 hypothetical protein DANDELION_178 [Mycobacterium phage Dandelion]
MPAHANAVRHKADWRSRTREWAIAELGGACVRCSTTDELQFDHVDAKTKLFDISVAIRDCYSRDRIAVELTKCQLLCPPHHLDKTRESGDNTAGGHNKILDPQHGTAVMYGPPNKCRCDECRNWKKLYRAKLVDSLGRPRATEAHMDGRGHGKAEVDGFKSLQ